MRQDAAPHARKLNPLILETGERFNMGRNGREGGPRPGSRRTSAETKTGLAAGLDENRHRLRPEHGNRRIRAMNLPVDEQGDGAFVVPGPTRPHGSGSCKPGKITIA